MTQLEPSLELERVTRPTGEKCGSIFIDENFKQWLRKTLGSKHYSKLDPRKASQKISAHSTEGEQMRAIMRAFDAYKRKFAKSARPMKMDLPEPLDNLDMGEKVVGGELTISKYDLEGFCIFGC